MGKHTIKQELATCWRRVRQQAAKIQGKERLILVCASIFLLLGVLVLLMPRTAKKSRLKEQAELTEVILSGGDTLEINAHAYDGVIPFYDETEAEELDYFGSIPPLEEQIAASEASEEEKPKKTEIVGIGVLKIDKIDLTLPVAEGVSKSTLKVAAGHVSETAAIGQQGNAVIAAHRSYTRGEFFNRLDELTVGDSISYTDRGGAIYRFNVIDIQTLEPSDSAVFDIRTGQSDLTLYTCTPVRVASHRLMVRCTLVEKIS